MAINWLFALKAVPWTDLVQAAPHLVKGARRLFNSARSSEPPPPGGADEAFGAEGVPVQERLRQEPNSSARGSTIRCNPCRCARRVVSPSANS